MACIKKAIFSSKFPNSGILSANTGTCSRPQWGFPLLFLLKKKRELAAAFSSRNP